MNVKANEWKPSVGAQSWTPGAAFQFQAGAGAAPVPVSVPTAETTSTPAAPPKESVKEEHSADTDESDPLWQCVLKIAKGDREKATRMLNDPDQLTQYPEVNALLAANSTGDGNADDWEQQEEEERLAQQLKEKATINEQQSVDVTLATKERTAPTPPPKQTLAPPTEVTEVALKEGDPREHINLVFIGHVDAGKSTLSGNILYLTDNVDKRTIERYEREAKERNRESWFLAFIMDTNEEERAKGKTVEVGKAHFNTTEKRYTILDAPGHKNYVPNMIMGASQADIGVLVISARKGEFETGFDRGGQTREHAMLSKTLGVSYLVVVVNKMDDPTVQWSKERFDECVTKLRPFLRSCGFVIKREVKFMPISGLSGANVKDEVDSSECPWWKKSYTKGENNTNQPTLLKLLNTMEISGREPNAPLRIPVLDRYTDRGTIAMGKVESGVIRPGMKVTLMPTRNVYKVDSIWLEEDPVKAARPGESVLIKLNGAGTEDVRKGFVICTDPPCPAVDKIICQIAIMEMPDNTRIMTAGFKSMFHAHTCEEECTIVKIFETRDKKGVVNKSARFASVGTRVVCMIQLARTVPVETFDERAFLGRFTLRTDGKTIAIGKITKLPPKKE